LNYSFIIRKAVPEDAPAIHEIMQEAFLKYKKAVGLDAKPDALQESLSDIEKDIINNEVFIALIDNTPVGSVRVKILDDSTGYITRFGVRPSYNNIGIGKAMMNLVDKYLISKGVKKVCLHTASKYAELVRFYYGRGFYIHSTSDEKGYIRALMIKEY